MTAPTGELRRVPLGKRALLGAAAGLAAGAIAAVLSFLAPEFESRTLDIRHRLLARPGPAARDRIAVVLIDEESVESLAAQDADLRWPWPRELQAALVRFLRSAGARSVLFDVLFVDESRVGADDDRSFAAALAEAGNVHLAAKLEPGEPKADTPLVERSSVEVRGWIHPAWEGLERIVGPLPVLAEKAAGLGAINVFQDRDSTIRRADLLFPYRGKLLPSLGFAAARSALGPLEASVEGRWLLIRSPEGDVRRRIPLGAGGRLLLRYYGPEMTFPMHHAADLVRSWGNLEAGEKPAIDPTLFKDRVVFVAVRIAGNEDIITVPTSIRMPGVELHATLCGNILEDSYLRELLPVCRTGLTVLAGLAAGLLAFLLWRPLRAAAAVLALAALWAVGAAAAFPQGLVLDVFYPLLGAGLAYVGSALAGYFGEGRQKREVSRAFEQYLSPVVIRDLFRDPGKLRLGGETREITVFFSDIQGFSTFSEGMTPQELVSFLNLYLGAMTDVILEHRGVVDKYEGDAIMAFWGAPEDLADDALQACQATLRQRDALAALNERFRAEGRPLLRIRAGLHRGPAVVGNMGSPRRFAYTAMGDTVNLASRLEGANKFFGTSFLLSDSVASRAREAVATRRLGRVRVVGKAVPVEVHELVGRRGEVPESDLRRIALFEGALALLEKGEFPAAAERLREYLASGPDRHAERCLALAVERSAGGPPWDGVWVLETK